MIKPKNNDALLGHESVEQEFFQAFNLKKLHHAWLLCGERGIGKATLAYKIARFLLSQTKNCKKNQNLEPLNIGNNDFVVNHLDKLHCPDFMLVDSESSQNSEQKKNNIITVDEIRTVENFLYLTPAVSKFRVVLIDSVDSMNYNAANAFLKILEEPRPDSIIILICHSIHNISLALKSRCRILRMSKLSEQNFNSIISSLLPKITEQELSKLYVLSNGNASFATLIYSQETFSVISQLQEMIGCYNLKNLNLILNFINQSKSNWEIVKSVLITLLHNQLKCLAIESADSKLITMGLKNLEHAEDALRNSDLFHIEHSSVFFSILTQHYMLCKKK